MSAKNKIAAVAALLLASCAVGPDFTAPAAPPGDHYTADGDPAQTAQAGGAAQRFMPGAQIDAEWWKLFKSPALDAVMDEAIAGNPGLEAAQASLRASADNLRSGYGIFFPEIDANAGASRQRSTPVKSGFDFPPNIFNLFTLSATVSYTLDIWGGNRRLIEELGAETDFARATQQAAYLTLSANIADTVIARAAYRAEIDATRQLIDMQKQQAGLAETQAQAGVAPYSTVLSLRGQLAASEAAIPQLEQKLAQGDDLLATLAGHTPAGWKPPEIDLADLALPENLPVSLPSDLVRQRPDILAAEATAHAAAAAVGVATAAMLPAITLNGSYGANSTSTNTLFTANGNFWSGGASAAMPVFDAGTLWFKREAAEENYNQAAALYRQTVLAAFAQVADALRAIEHDAQALRAEDDALAAAGQALHLTQANFDAGIATYADVLNADIQYHQAKIADLQAIAMRYQDTVALFAALGGGWWNTAAEEGKLESKR